MFTKCFFSASKVFFVCEMGAFFLKMCFFFPWKGAFFKCSFLPKSTTIPAIAELLYFCCYWQVASQNNRLSNTSCLLGISKWASPIGDLVACRSEVREVGGSSPRPVNIKKKKKKKIKLQQILLGHRWCSQQD